MFLRNKTGVNAPPGVNGLREDDRIPVIKVVSGDSWVVDADLIAADGGPASPKNSYVEFVLSENQFSPPIWTGEWINGVLPDENIPGLVHIRIPGEITKSIRRGSYMFSVRVSDQMKFTFSTQLKGNFLVEYMPTSDHRSIPYRDGTSEIFGGSLQTEGGESGGGSIDIEGYDELVKTVDKLKIIVAKKADSTSVYSKEETDEIVQGMAAVTDLPYALVTLELSDDWIKTSSGGEDLSAVTFDEESDEWHVELDDGHDEAISGDGTETALSFTYDEVSYVMVRPYELIDRASCKLATSSAATLVHPAALGGGRLRDFIVRLVLLGPSVPIITFADPQGETITYETDGDAFPVPDDTGTWLYAFTETDDGVFDVSLTKVKTVEQGGAT